MYTNINEWAIIKMKGGNVMPDDIRNIVYKFSLQLRDLLGSSLSKVILYGSYARGDNHDHSDVDVMILVKMTDAEIKRIENDVYDMAFEIEIETGIDISPIIKNEEQYEYWVDTLPFYRNVRDEGVVING
ncbi:nucleotidyltransferase domain-containing protein [Blautia marasmi]|uniref:nucleotidyltransferase domain-containing protein n=1 Tax=Blautia marasmi TaxID=1917868 RepID=UPI0025999CA4|nr:nucleotidyltransferase domain-containing protein [uncultured Blautia sp.]